MINDFLQEQFNLRAESPSVWVLSARRLKRGGDIICDAYEIDLRAMERGSSPLELDNLETVGVATLLYGLSIENLIKAIIIHKDPNSIKNGKLREWPGTGHNLINLAKEAGIVFNKEQFDFLNRLVAFVEWAGKYPVPKNATKISLKQLGIDQPYLPLPLKSNEKTLFTEIFDMLLEIIS